MLILSILYFSYLGRSPTLLFAIKKAFLLIDPLRLRWCSCDGPPALLDDGDVASDVLADLLRCRWLLHEYPSVEFSTLVALGFLLNFLKLSPISLKWDKFGRFERLILTIWIGYNVNFFCKFSLFFILCGPCLGTNLTWARRHRCLLVLLERGIEHPCRLQFCLWFSHRLAHFLIFDHTYRQPIWLGYQVSRLVR